MTTATIQINLDAVETADLLAALESRGHTPEAKPLEVSDMIEAIEERGFRVVEDDNISVCGAVVRFEDMLDSCDAIEREQLLAHIRREHGAAVAASVWS